MKVACAIAICALLWPLEAAAQQHPYYLHALQDLRYARALLEHGEGWDWGPVAGDQQRAVNEVEHAIQELRQAAMDDGRNPNNHPPVDVHSPGGDRLRRTMEALDSARDDITREEINSAAREQRNRAFRHIEEARRAVRHAIERWRG